MNLVYGEIVSLGREEGMAMGTVRVSGALKRISLDLLTKPQCGDTVLLCDGVAIAKVAAAGRAGENYVSGHSG